MSTPKVGMMCAEAYVPESQYNEFRQQQDGEVEPQSQYNIIILLSLESGVSAHIPANIRSHFTGNDNNKYIYALLGTDYTDAVSRVVDKRDILWIPDDLFNKYVQTPGSVSLNTRLTYKTSEPVAAHEQMHAVSK